MFDRIIGVLVRIKVREHLVMSTIPFMNLISVHIWTYLYSNLLVISAAIFQPSCRPLLDIRRWLSVVSVRYHNQCVRNGLFLEELALPKNSCSYQSLCCDNNDRRVDSCHGDC